MAAAHRLDVIAGAHERAARCLVRRVAAGNDLVQTEAEAVARDRRDRLGAEAPPLLLARAQHDADRGEPMIAVDRAELDVADVRPRWPEEQAEQQRAGMGIARPD